MTMYPIYGTGYPVIKLYNSSNTLISTATMSSANCIVRKNTISEDKNDIEYENLDNELVVRKGVRRMSGIIELDNVATSLIDTLRSQYEYDGEYGYYLKLQPFSGNSSLNIEFHFTSPILPVNADELITGRRKMMITWKAKSANVAFSGIKKYT